MNIEYTLEYFEKLGQDKIKIKDLRAMLGIPK